MTDRYGASPSDWAHLDLLLGLRAHLLPVVSNPSAPISPNSALKRLGQIPSLYNHEDKVVGFAKWTEHTTTSEEITKWSSQPDYGICIQTRAVRALDCDITHEGLAEEVFRFLAEQFADLNLPMPVRGRENASKFLIPLLLDGAHPKRILKLKNGNPTDKIEFLADGQQFIAVGTHPSGAKYEWASGLPHEIPTLTETQFTLIWQKLETLFGAEPSTTELPTQRNAPGGEINDSRLEFLEKAGVILGYSPEGSAYITCPFKQGHSKEGDKTETIYFPAGLRDYAQGHFKCLHASCAAYADDDFLNALNYTASQFDSLPEEIPDPSIAGRFTPVPISEYSQRPPPEWIIKNVIPKSDLVVLFGESGAGKSFLALDMAFAIARGVQWNNLKTRQGKIIYVCAEDAGGARNRAVAYALQHNLSLVDIPLFVIADAPNLLDDKESSALARAIADQGPAALIIIDTFAQATPGANENSAEDIGKALKHCRAIRKMTNSTVLLVHHAGKDLTKGARGWSGLRAAADAEIEVSRNGETRNIKISKQKNSQDGAEWGMSLREVPIGMDEDDVIISSCVVEYSNKKLTKPKEKKLGGTQQLVVDSFYKHGLQCIAPKILSITARDCLPVPEGRDTRLQRVQRALEELITQKVFMLKEGFVYLYEESL